MIKLNKQQIKILEIIYNNPNIEFDEIEKISNIDPHIFPALIHRISNILVTRSEPKTEYKFFDMHYKLTNIGRFYIKLLRKRNSNE